MMAVQGFAVQTAPAQQDTAARATNPVGRWRIKFTLVGGTEKNLEFESRADGSGSFRLLDTGVDDKPVPTPQPAAWSLTGNNLSISSEVELSLGSCTCRETGTLIFKAKSSSENSMSGKLIFVTNIEEEESPYKFRTTVGTFTATRLPNH
jgi:hypothetical protein